MSRPVILGLVGAAVAVGIAVFVVFGVLPRHEATIEPVGQIVAAPGSSFEATVENSGLAGGTFKETLTVDGEDPVEVSVEVPGRGTATVGLPLPDSLAPGQHTLELGSQTVDFVALTPAELKLGKLEIDKPVAKTGDTVTLSLRIENEGEADGTFPGVLKLNGSEVETEPTTVKGGAITTVTFTLDEKKARAYRVDLSGARGRVVYVKTTRPKNGAILMNSLGGGFGRLMLKNGYKEDCMVVLTAKPSGRSKPLLKVFVRAKHDVTVSAIRDGSFYVYFARGDDWTRYNEDFLDCLERRRFPKPMAFRTSSWTTSSTDWAAGVIWTTRHTRYPGWKIQLNSGKKGGVYCPEVPDGRFPGI